MAELNKEAMSTFPRELNPQDNSTLIALNGGINVQIPLQALYAFLGSKFIPQSEKNVINGIPTLDENGKIRKIQLPDFDINISIQPINLSTPIPTQNGVFEPIEAGVYTNFGGIEITNEDINNSITYIYYYDGVFTKQSKSVLAVDKVEPFNQNAVTSNAVYDWSIRNVSTIAELRTIKGEAGQKINLLGYYEAGDKPSLLYKWVSGVVEDDGGSVIRVDDGYWSALKNYLNIKDFDNPSSFFSYINKGYVNVIDLSDSNISINVDEVNKIKIENKSNIHIILTNCRVKNNTDYSTLIQNNFIEIIKSKNITSEGTIYFEGNRSETIQGNDRGCNVVFINESENVNIDIESVGNRCAMLFFQSIENGKYSKNINTNIKCINNHYPSVVYNVVDSSMVIHSINSYRSLFAMGIQRCNIKCYAYGQVGASILKAYHNNIPMINNEISIFLKDIKPYTALYPITIEYQTDIPKDISNNNINVNIEHVNENNKLINGVFGLSNMNVNGTVRNNSVGHSLENNNINISGVLKNVQNIVRFPMHTNKFAFFDGDLIGDLNLNISISNDIQHLNTLNLIDGKLNYHVINKSDKTNFKLESSLSNLNIYNSKMNSLDKLSASNTNVYDSSIANMSDLDKNNVFFSNSTHDVFVLNRKGGDSTYSVSSGYRGDLSSVVLHEFKGTIRANCRFNIYAVKDINNPLNDFISGYFDFVLYQTGGGGSAYRNIKYTSTSSTEGTQSPEFLFNVGVMGGIGVKIGSYNTSNSKITSSLTVSQYHINSSNYSLIK